MIFKDPLGKISPHAYDNNNDGWREINNNRKKRKTKHESIITRQQKKLGRPQPDFNGNFTTDKVKLEPCGGGFPFQNGNDNFALLNGVTQPCKETFYNLMYE